MRQEIIVPDKVTTTYFDLPCINSVHKFADGTPRFLLHPSETINRDWQHADPGDTLIEEDNGKWRVEKQRQQ